MSRVKHEATAYLDPVTGNVNLILVEREGDDVSVGDEFDCGTRRPVYVHAPANGNWAPTPVTAALTVDEAEALHRALEAVLTEVSA